MDEAEENAKIAERALASYLDEYKEGSEIWKTLENKAQVTITIAGVFLAAVFSFSRDAALTCSIKTVLGLTLGALLTSLFFALSVLKASTYDVPFDSGATFERAEEMLASSYDRGETGSRYLKLISFLSSGFVESLRGLDAVNEIKEKRLSYAHQLLIVAASFATIAAVIELVTH